MAAAIPWIGMAISAVGAVSSGVQKSEAAAANASAMNYEAKTASDQGYEAEAAERRKTGMILGSEVAAAGQAGAGYQGSTGRSINQSALNMEKDALNIRYKAQLQKWGYTTQAGNIAYEGQQEATSDYLKAGGSLLRGYSGNYLG